MQWPQTVEKASQSFLRKQKIKSKSFSAGAHTWKKILLRLQVWNLFALGEQIMRVADCKNWWKAPKGIFDTLKGRCLRSGLFSIAETVSTWLLPVSGCGILCFC